MPIFNRRRENAPAGVPIPATPPPPDHSRGKTEIATDQFLSRLMDLSVASFWDGTGSLPGVKFPDTQLRRLLPIPPINTSRACILRSGGFDYGFVEGASMGLKPERYFMFGKLPHEENRELDPEDVGYLETLVGVHRSGVIYTNRGFVIIECAADSRSLGGANIASLSQNGLLTEPGLEATLDVVIRTLNLS